jgi:hypothetical protein
MTVALSGQRRYILVRATCASAAMASILIGRNPISRPEVGLFQNAGVGVFCPWGALGWAWGSWLSEA